MADDEIMLVIGEDGKARKYDDTYDITIHCVDSNDQAEMVKNLQKGAKALEALKKVREEMYKLSLVWEYGQGVRDCIEILEKHMEGLEDGSV